MERYRYSDEEKAVLEGLEQPLAVYQLIDGHIITLAVSDGFCRLLGYEDRGQAVYDMDHDMYKDTHPDDKERLAAAAWRFAEGGDDYDVIFRTRAGVDSDYQVIHAHGKHVFTKSGVRLAHVWYMDEGRYVEGDEASGTKMNRELNSILHEESILKALRYDALTGLPNLAYFFKLCEIRKARVFREGKQGALLYMDLDGMKFFNHKNGFAEGDNLLKAFASLLADTFGHENSCHIGADRFAASVTDDGLEEKLLHLFAQFERMEQHLPVRVGIYSTRIEDVPVSSAYDRAKMACDELRKSDVSAFNYYSENLRNTVKRRQYIQSSIDRAISERWIQVYYQPIVRAVNGKVCDEEALARWIDPEEGFLSPAEFIPQLELSGQIYKLDLYVLEQVLEKMHSQQKEGLSIVPHSINLSRSDFDSCDIVEEIRKRVDEAGIARELITIEITESMIGSDFDFMKNRVERFRKLGFPVWMDDFGSGYSSLDVLQSIRFDLIKFDMSFMKRLEESDNARIILKELMRMAASLNLDTVCEGVETDAQVRFLQEIGCSKLQGFFYCKPIPYEEILARYRQGRQIGFEDPGASAYYDTVGQFNLYDLDVMASSEDGSFQHTFNTLPIGIIEVKDGTTRFVRSNSSYREFIRRSFGMNMSDMTQEFVRFQNPFMINIEKRCCEQGNRAFFDEKLPDGSIVHSFARRIGTNPVSGEIAVAIAVLSISDPYEGESYADIAGALAADYYNIYVIDLDTDDFIEYSSQVGGEEMALERRGQDFFTSARQDTMTRIYEEDRESFLALFTKENVLKNLAVQGVFTTTYRLIDTGTPMYVNMKITRMHGGNRIILGISNIDAHMKQLEEEKKLRQEKSSLGRIAALSPDYIVLYTVDPETGHYTQYSPSNEFEKFGLAKQGEDFFADVILDAPKAIAPEDMERHLRVLTKENMLSIIQKTGVFTHHYRMIMNGKYVPASLKATLIEEENGKKIILGVTNDENEEIRHKLEEASKIKELNQTITSLLENMPGMAFTKDAGTGVYLTCNQAFADYAHKATPDGVAGLTDAEIFDAETAAHFVEDDQHALSMDKPYIFFEDVPDAAGNKRQLQTTKFKYIDASGRLCLQGMCQDVTDMVRIQRENARTKEAYLQASDTATIYARLQAITGSFIVVYDVDPQTNRYREFSATNDYEESFGTDKEGLDFFSSVRRDARVFAHPQDLNRFLAAFTKENVLAEIERSGIFTWGYRIMMDGKPLHVQMIAVMVEEKEGPRLIVGLNDIDAQVRQGEELEKRLTAAQSQANIDALTGGKNKHAYLEAETHMDCRIAEHRQSPFAIVIFDVNDLKKVNDSKGHQAGDRYLLDACKKICDIFKHSPVYRVGGDEFAVIAQGRDYENIEELVKTVNDHNSEALRSGGIAAACGMAKYDGDECVAEVFERADHNMYENKNSLKSAAIKWENSNE